VNFPLYRGNESIVLVIVLVWFGKIVLVSVINVFVQKSDLIVPVIVTVSLTLPLFSSIV
jgi:hypothetical protein